MSYLRLNILIGIGRELAKALVSCNAEKVYAVSKTKANLDSLILEEPSIVPVELDISDWNEVRNVISKLGRIDGLVNNAGIAILESFFNIKPETFDR